MNVYRDSYLVKPRTKKFETDIPGMLEVEVGTNGYRGGDAGHGSSTYFRIENGGSSVMEVDINKDKDGFEVALGGDWELSSVIEALEKIVITLKAQSSIRTEIEEVMTILDQIVLEDNLDNAESQIDEIVSKLTDFKQVLKKAE